MGAIALVWCAVRSIVRTALVWDLMSLGFLEVTRGLIEGRFRQLDRSSVGNILQTGEQFYKPQEAKIFVPLKDVKKAFVNLKSKGIGALIVIGGNGSFKGAHIFSEEHAIPVIGIPATIDNDISGTEYTIGFDTAVQTAIEAVDKIRDTAE